MNHEQAQHWLNARLDGMLSPVEAQALDVHLQACPACRRYAVQIEKLDNGLRRHFRETAARRSPASQRDDAALRPLPNAADSVSDQVRVTMFAKRIWNFAGSAALVLGLLALVGALAFLTTRFIAPAQPGRAQILTATPPPTATPLPPTPTPGPMTAAEPVAAVLERLAERNARLLHQPGWVRTQSFNAAEDPASMVYYYEIWQHYPQTDGICTESFSILRAKPESPDPIEFYVWSAGMYGELMKLREGEGQVETRSADSMQCVTEAGKTLAGDLAARLLGKSTSLRKDAGKDLQTVKAWYETVDGRPAFVVEAEFHNDQSTLPVQVEQQTFDLETGLLIRMNIAQQYANGSPFSEMRVRIQTDTYAELPTETAQRLQQAAAELAAYQSGKSAGTVSPTPTLPPAPAAADIQWVAALGTDAPLPTTYNAGLTDVNAIVSALHVLRQRQLQWLSRLGWYIYENPAPVTGEELDVNRRTLIHVTGEGRCELMTYYRKGSLVLPQEIRPADGSWGLISPVESGIFTDGKAQDVPCALETLEPVQLLDQQIEGFPDQAQREQTRFRAWIGKTADTLLNGASAGGKLDGLVKPGRSVLVVVTDTTYTDPKPRMMDPATRKLEALDRAIEWHLYDLESGAPLGFDRQAFLGNGNGSGRVLGELPDWSEPLPVGASFYTLTYPGLPPADLAEAFEKAVKGLAEYLKK
jgi:anti-sigma factor RsiW